MPRQVKTTPRKRPRQERSKATVDTILAATARVLVKQGPGGLTTNAVAEAAGVSIGSLYQYFPNKQALVAALIETHMSERNARLLERLAGVASLPIATAVRLTIEFMFENHASNPALKRIILMELSRVGRLARVLELHAGTYRMVAQLLAARKAEVAVEDIDSAAFVLVSAIEAVAHRALFFDPERLRDPRLIEEATTMVTRYLGVSAG
ncbi:MAG: TetR/AcrR family transcriptional regulator [Kofleriaceae bacterium]|nr:TetR/AcrR family transcriptional regulator [Kofleriaceae bacterium]